MVRGWMVLVRLLIVSSTLAAVNPAVASDKGDIRILVMKFETDRGVDPALARALQDRILKQARDQGFLVSGESEMIRLLDAEAKQALLGCTDDPRCLSNAAGEALRADWLVFGRLTRLDDSFELNLRLARMKTGRVTRQVNHSASTSETDLAAVVAPSMAMLLTRPLALPLEEAISRAPRPFYTRPWVWGGAAGLTALGVVAAFLIRPPAAGGALGKVTLDAP